MFSTNKTAAPVLLVASLSFLAACESDLVAPRDLAAVVPSLSLGLPNGATADTLSVGGTVQLVAPSPSGPKRDRQTSWGTSDPAVASVSTSGLVTARAVGVAMITGRNGTRADSARIVVLGTTAPPSAAIVAPVASVTVTAPATSLPVGQTAQLTATLKDSAGNVLTGRSVSWASSAVGIGTVVADGLFSAVAAGSTLVTATAEGRSGSLTMTVTAALLAGGSCRVVTDVGPRAVAGLAKPAYLGSAVDPAFGTTVTRVTGDPGAAIPGVGGAWGSVARHRYAKSAAWSADERLLVLTQVPGAAGGSRVFLDGATYRPLFARYAPGNASEWHPTAPDTMVYVTAAGAAGYWDVRTNAASQRFAAAGYTGADLGLGEGSPSRDGRYVVVTATRTADGARVAFAADLHTGAKGADIVPAAFGTTYFDWASISPSGQYVVVHGTIGGQSNATRVFDRAGAPVAGWAGTYHMDLGLDAAGAEAGFGGDNNTVVKRPLGSGARLALAGGTNSSHGSTRNARRPGWGYVSTYGGSTASAHVDEVYAAALDGSGAVERLAHHRSTAATYDAQPHAVPSPDGRRVLFASDWGTAGGPVQAYVADARPLCGG